MQSSHIIAELVMQRTVVCFNQSAINLLVLLGMKTNYHLESVIAFILFLPYNTPWNKLYYGHCINKKIYATQIESFLFISSYVSYLVTFLLLY